jgi:hypothetical protein
LISTFLLPLFSNIAIRMLSLKTRYTHWMLPCDSTVNTDWHCWWCWIFALCQLWSVHRSSLVWHLFCLYLRIPDEGYSRKVHVH